MRARTLTFTGSRGQRLSAVLDFPPDNRPQAFGIFAHCFSASAESNAGDVITRALNEFGIATLLLDFGGSFEERAADARPLSAADIIAAGEALTQEYEAPRLLVGHSVGGTAALRAATELDSVKALATVGAPCACDVASDAASSGPDAPDDVVKVRLAHQSIYLERALLDDLVEGRLMQFAAQLGRPLLVAHSPFDDVFGVDNARSIFEAARHPKSFVSLDHADHFLTDRSDAEYFAQVLCAWARKYLGIHPEMTTYADARDNRVAARTTAGSLRTDIIANGFPLVADEPESVGGSNSGPSPYDYLAAALGACTSMTLRMYADRKKWDLAAVTTRVRHTRIHVKDCDDCDEKGKRLDRLERDVELEGDLDDEQRRRLLEIAERCPVHRTLSSRIEIDTSLADAADILDDEPKA